MNNKRFPNNIRNHKASVIKYHPGISVAGQKWWKITAVKRMFLRGWIVVHARLVKRWRTVSIIMNMHTKETGRSWFVLIRKLKGFYLYKRPSGRNVVERGKSANRTYGIAPDICNGSRAGEARSERK